MEINTSCRTCMKNNTDLVSLFEQFKTEESDSLPLAEVLQECFSILVSADDGLPQNLCTDCANLIQLVHKFRKQAFDSEKEFKKFLANNLEAEIKDEKDVQFKNESDNDDNVYFDFGFNQECDQSQDENLMQTVKVEKNYQCNICEKQFSKETKLIKHALVHEKPPLVCPLCGKTFSKQSSLDKHLVKHSMYNKCNICFENFNSLPLLLEHTKIHSDIEVKTEIEIDVERYTCSVCCLVFNKSRSLSMHMRKHKNEENCIRSEKPVFKCDICTKEFGSKSMLRRHMKLHSNVQPLACPKCPKRYTRQDQLQEHLKRHESGKPNICTYCSKAFSQLCSLKDHLRTHTGETPYLCSECGKGFNNSSNLRQHMMRHTGVKPYSCTLCPKSFCTKGQMTCHMTTHTGVHPYKCEQCGAAFTKPNSLKKHQLIHLGVRPFACDTCNMRFTCKDHLKRHYRIHTGEKPYKCAYCERAFTQSNDLVKHTRQHIGQNIYQCTVCDMRFRLKSELKQHYPIHYVNGEQPPPLAIDKDQVAPVLTLSKPIEEKPCDVKDISKDIDRTITITISRNGMEKNGIAGDITINIGNVEKS